jgi:mannonate dehydratase
VIALEEAMRWFGPDDPVTLADIRQCGCRGVFTALHHVPYGEVWSREEIAKRKRQLAACGLAWSAVESLPVSEDVKTRTGDYRRHLESYRRSIAHLGAEGVEVVIYNFMPVLDWIRTDLAYRLDDGTECLSFDPVRFAAFELFVLEREGAAADYRPEQVAAAETFFERLSAGERKAFERNLIDLFPGVAFGYSIEDVRAMLAGYRGAGRATLQEHLRRFLEAVVPACEEAGVRLAVHPDDPPRPMLGMPRIVSTEEDVRDVIAMVDSPANGLCFCTGSFSARAENDLPGMVERWGHRINACHLRSTQRDAAGGFHEANHLEGSVDMVRVVTAALLEMKRRRDAGRRDWRLAFRPDHGHRMLDDLAKPPPPNPGYSCIGRLRGLAEIRGLQLGIARALELA